MTILQNALDYLHTLYKATDDPPYDFQAVHTTVIDFTLEHGLAQWPQAGTGYRYWLGITTVEPENPFVFVSNDGITWAPAPGTTHQMDDTGADWNMYDGYGPDFDFSEDIELVYDPLADCIHAYWMHTTLLSNPIQGDGIRHRTINNNLTVSAKTAIGIPWVNHEMSSNSPTVIREASDKWHMWGIYQDVSLDSASNPLLRKLTYRFGTSPTSWGEYQLCDMAVDPMIAYPNDTPNHITAELNPTIPGQVDLVIQTLRWPLEVNYLSKAALVHAVTHLSTPTAITTPLAPTRLLEYAPLSWEKLGLYRSGFTLQLVGTEMIMRLWYTGVEDYMHPRIGLTSGAIYEVVDGAIVPPPDTSAPTVTAFTLPTTSTTLEVALIALTASESDCTFILSESGIKPQAGDVRWGVAPTSYTFNSSGSKTLYAWAKDAAGNVSAGVGDTVMITLDTAGAGLLTGVSTVTSVGSITGIGVAAMVGRQIRAPNGTIRILRRIDGTLITNH